MISEIKFQIGKNGLTSGVIEFLNQAFKTHKRIRVAVLKSAVRDRESIKALANEICQKVDVGCVAKIIGFTIILIRAGKKR